jgi:hypothetical protein
VDPATDSQNCGACGVVCGSGQGCSGGQCVAGAESCEPGAVGSCYSGAPGTEGVGVCRPGTRTCDAAGYWSACQDEITPVTEVCANNLDDDCNGAVDEENDADGDGWTNCRGDCCDAAGFGCAEPLLVNPGAFEVAGNDVDDDCDGVIDNPVAVCDSGLPSNSANALQYAAAMDLCQTTIEDPPVEDKRWGVISAELVRASGSGTPATSSRAIRPKFGASTTRLGDSMVVLSTGNAAAPGDESPSFSAFERGKNMGTTSTVPGDWLSANGGSLPNAPGCPQAAGGNTANDPVMLKLRVRVPTNARSFSVSANFFSAEYPEWVCSPYNDFFVVLLDSGFAGDPANPPDKNLARYTAPDMTDYPVGVNLAYGNTGLFQVCLNGPTGCEGEAVSGTVTACTGTGELVGTGFDRTSTGCGSSNLAGGGTGWLVTSGNVVPGEIMELRLAIWDTSDHLFDSLVLLDNFQWSVEASDPGTVIIE